jgi:hypothetical protein
MPPSDSHLSPGATAGIGAGSGIAALFLVMLIIYLIWKSRQNQKDRSLRESFKGLGFPSTRASGTSYTSPTLPSHSPHDSKYGAFTRQQSPQPSGLMQQNQFSPHHTQQELFQPSPQYPNMTANFTPTNLSNLPVHYNECLDQNMSGPTLTEMSGVGMVPEMSADGAWYELEDQPQREMSEGSVQSGWRSAFRQGALNQRERRGW